MPRSRHRIDSGRYPCGDRLPCGSWLGGDSRLRKHHNRPCRDRYLIVVCPGIVAVVLAPGVENHWCGNLGEIVLE
ncbi:MAG: hypothetical protein OEM02_09740 [Desulfobulbaceae bacterium]|nr:hypothetical protein [Desulfobulbaceae bacterium]